MFFISKSSVHATLVAFLFQIVKEGWVSPVTRKRLLDPRFNPPKEAKLLSESLGPSFRRTLTGPFAVEQIKARLYQG